MSSIGDANQPQPLILENMKEKQKDSNPTTTTTTTTAAATTTSTKDKIQDLEGLTLSKLQGISESFVQQYNTIFGNQESEGQLRFEFHEIVKLGGLDGSHQPSIQDIRTARLAFAILAENRNPETCLPALKHLQTLIKKDPITVDSSADIIPLIKRLLNQMDKTILEEKNKAVQFEYVKTLSCISELILEHNAADHLGKITEDLKIKLDGALEGLSRLNSKKDLNLTFQIKCAREAIKRFKDDSQIVFDMLRRIFHLSMAAAAYFYTDIILPDEIKKTFLNTHIKMHIKESWYESILLLKQMGKSILEENNELTDTQRECMVKSLLAYICISKNEVLQKWPFYYAVVDLLSQIVIKSSSRLLQTLAFDGCAIKYINPKTNRTKTKELKGLADYAQFNYFLLKKRSINPGTTRYSCVDYNAEIRLATVEHLFKISNESKNIYLRERAKNILFSRLILESSLKVRYLLDSKVPANLKKQQEWLNESDLLPSNRSKNINHKHSHLSSHLYAEDFHKAGNKIHSDQTKRHSISAQDKNNYRKSLALASQDLIFTIEKEEVDSPSNAPPHTLKEEATEAINDYSEKLLTLESTQQSQENNKEISQLLFHRGVCYLFKNQVNKGKNDLKSAYKYDPTNFKSAFELAKLYAELKVIEKVKKWANRALSIQPGHRGAKQLISIKK